MTSTPWKQVRVSRIPTREALGELSPRPRQGPDASSPCGCRASGSGQGLRPADQDRASGFSGRKKPPEAKGLPSVGCGACRRSSWVRPLQPPSVPRAGSGPPGSCFLSGLPQRVGRLLQPEQQEPGPLPPRQGPRDSSPSEGSRCPPCSLEAQEHVIHQPLCPNLEPRLPFGPWPPCEGRWTSCLCPA